MNLNALKQAEKRFLKSHPGGFSNPELQEVLKKHKTKEITALVKQNFGKDAFNDVPAIMDNAIKLIGKSTLISMFEKPKFKDMVNGFSKREKDLYAEALFEQLHGKQQTGFETQLELFTRKKMAKWTLLTVLPNYYRPKKDLLIKPTTTKLIIKELELEHVYKPTPSWSFYQSYRKEINALRKKVDASLSPSNMAFCGFLMMEL